jgi:adenylate kinase family enzyme
MRIYTVEWMRDMITRRDSEELGEFFFHNRSHDARDHIFTEFIDFSVCSAVQKVHANGGCNRVVILVDGYPRTASQAAAIPGIVSGHPSRAIELSVSQKDAGDRARTRDRGNDDRERGLAIRLASYSKKITLIRQPIVDARLNLIHASGVRDIHTAVSAVVRDDTIPRVPIPQRPPVDTSLGDTSSRPSLLKVPSSSSKPSSWWEVPGRTETSLVAMQHHSPAPTYPTLQQHAYIAVLKAQGIGMFVTSQGATMAHRSGPQCVPRDPTRLNSNSMT